jgi:hypothetical protein
MKRKWLGLAAASALALQALSCSTGQQLVSISIQPATESFGSSSTPVDLDAGANVQLRALGSYTHPPATKDLTNQVVWASNTPDLSTVSATGLLTATGLGCGNALVSATVTNNTTQGGLSSQGALTTGYMTSTVVCFTGGGPTVTADFAGTGTGTISSSPIGLGCATTCTATFSLGTTVTITAAPTGLSTFGGWAGCDTVSGPVCVVRNLTNNITITVTFN